MGRFNPVEYFGGYNSEDIGTGIIREIMVHMFSPDQKENSRKFPSEHNQTLSQEHKNIIPKMSKQKASQSQTDLDPSKYPHLAEISSSLHTSQSRINQLMNNLHNLKCPVNNQERNKFNQEQNNSFLKYQNPKVIYL